MNHQRFKKFPIGLSTLEEIVSHGYYYVDKTYYVHKLAGEGKYYFLSRPRRFGKSLVIDTLKQAFLGNKALFKGLYLEDHWNWDGHYPVIHISFASNQKESAKYTLEDKIEAILESNGRIYDVLLRGKDYSDQFSNLIVDIHEKVNQKVVILIDEYDKPILDAISDMTVAENMRDILRGFYSVIMTKKKL